MWVRCSHSHPRLSSPGAEQLNEKETVSRFYEKKKNLSAFGTVSDHTEAKHFMASVRVWCRFKNFKALIGEHDGL